MDYEALKRLLEGVNQKNEPNMSMGTLASTPAVQEDDSQQIQQELPIQEEQLSLAETSQESTPSSQDINELRRGQQQFETYQLQKEAEDIDPKSEYLKLIQDYRKKINTPKKDTSTLEGFSAIANVLNQAAGIEAANRGANFRGMDTQAMLGQLKQQEAAERQQDLSGLDNLQKMYQQYLAMQAKSSPKALTDLDKAKIDSEKARAAKFLADAKKAERAESKESKSEFQKVKERELAKANVEYFRKDRDQLISNSDKIDNALKILKDKDIGPTISGPWRGLAPDKLRSITNPQAIIVKESIQSAIQETLRPTLGAQFTEKEGERIMNLAYNDTLPPSANIKRAEELQKLINRKMKFSEDLYKHLEENDGSDKGFDYSKYGMGKSDKKTDPKIEDYAKKYNLDYDKAQQILRARGYNG